MSERSAATQLAAANSWGYCSWCGMRDAAPMPTTEGSAAEWACAVHWPPGLHRPSRAPAEPSTLAGFVPLDRDAFVGYWERADDDPAPSAVEAARLARLT